MRKILIFILFLTFPTLAFCATDYSQDAACEGWWKMDDTGDQTDSCGSNTLTETGGTIDLDTSDFKTSTGSRDFEESDGEYLLGADGTNLDITGSITYMAWTKMESLSGANAIISKHNSADGNKQYYMDYVQLPDNIYRCWISNDGSANVIAESAINGVIGSWIHLACVYDGTDLRLYVNGLLNPSPTNPQPHTTGIYNGNSPFIIGERGNLVAQTDAKYDDVAVFSRALSAAEILEIKNNGVDGTGINRDVTLLGSFVTYQDDLDYYGGWTGLQTQGTLRALTGNYADRVTGQCLHDEGAFANRTFTTFKSMLQPDFNHFMYFGIKGHTDDVLCVVPSDRLDDYDVITNGTFATDSDWIAIGSPSTLVHTSSLAAPGYSDSYFVIAAENEGIQQGTLSIQGERGGHDSQWFGEYITIGMIYNTTADGNGIPYLRITDGGGTELVDTPIGLYKNVWDDWEISMDTSYVGAVTGTFEIYCNGGPCSFYLGGDVKLGEHNYGSAYNEYEGIDDYNSGDEQYAIQGGWRTELIGKKWWVINPLDNVQLLISANNFNASDGDLNDGVDFDGNTYCTNILARYGGSDCAVASFNLTPKLKEWGFNSLGSLLGEDAYPPLQQPESGLTYMPYIHQFRISRWNFSDVGEIQMTYAGGGSMDDEWVDVFDEDWETHITTTGVNGAAQWGCCLNDAAGSEFRQISGQYDINPYVNTKDRGLAWINPWRIGWDWDEEARGSAGGFSNIAKMIMGADHNSASSDSDGTFETKVYFVNWLRKNYSDTSEPTFLANITYGGSDYLTDTDNWATVTGTVAGADALALTKLNNNWGTTYSTWKEVWCEDGDDDSDQHGDGCDANAGFEAALVALEGSECADDGQGCRWGNTTEGTGTIRHDLDELHAEYAREYYRFIYDRIFGENGLYRGNKIAFGQGIATHPGWFKGVLDRDGITQLLDATYTTASWGTEDNRFTTFTFDVGPSASTNYNHTGGMPFLSESSWLTAERGSDAYFEGVVDRAYKYTDTDFALYVGDGATTADWDCDAAQYASISSYCSTTTNDYKPYIDQPIYWNCTDPTDTGTCSDSGLMYYIFNKTPDQPINDADFANRFIIKANSGSIGEQAHPNDHVSTTLLNNDVVTTGTMMFTIASTNVYRLEGIEDADANFDTNIDNPNSWDNRFSSLHIIDADDSDGDGAIDYMQSTKGHATERFVGCMQELHLSTSAEGEGWSEFLDCSLDIATGANYYTNFIYMNNSSNWETWKEMTGQKDRATVFSNVVKQNIDRLHVTDQGINYNIGYSVFSAAGDYGFPLEGGGTHFSNSGGSEHRNFGWFSSKVNAYDGVEATRKGADGVLGTSDDERNDYENFTDKAGQLQRGLYRDALMERNKTQGAAFNGVVFQ